MKNILLSLRGVVDGCGGLKVLEKIFKHKNLITIRSSNLYVEVVKRKGKYWKYRLLVSEPKTAPLCLIVMDKCMYTRVCIYIT